jgi:hypothetical protein
LVDSRNVLERDRGETAPDNWLRCFWWKILWPVLCFVTGYLGKKIAQLVRARLFFAALLPGLVILWLRVEFALVRSAGAFAV